MAEQPQNDNEFDREQLLQIERDMASPDVDIEELIGEEIDAPVGLGFDLVEETMGSGTYEPSEDGR